MNLGTIRAEVLARGFDHLSVTRANYLINVAYTEICEIENWPFLLTSATGAAPLTIADLRLVEAVTDSTQNGRELDWTDRRNLVSGFGDLSTVGQARYWFVDNGVVRTYPVGGTLTVRYYKSPADLSADGDTPVIPTRYHYLIVDVAVRKAYLDSDNFQAAAALQVEIDRQLGIMQQSLLGGQQNSGTEYVVDVGGSGDW